MRIPFTLLFVLAVLRVAAQSDLFSLGRLTTADGLSQDKINAITQDGDGFLWFGTEDGLTRFDGRRCRVFRHVPGDTTSLPDSRVTGLATDAGGRLWVSTQRGICRYEPASHTFRRIAIPSPVSRRALQTTYFSEMAFDRAGRGWAVTDSFLLRYNPRSGKSRFFKLPGPSRHEAAVFVDSRDRVWVTILGRHLYCYTQRTGAFTYVRGQQRPNGDPRPWPMAVREDSRGTVWCSDWDRGLYTWDEAGSRFVDRPDDGGIVTVFLFEERPGAPPVVWAGGGAHGLVRLDLATGRQTVFAPRARDPYAHNNTRVHALYRDPRTGIIWIGTELGVEYYDPNEQAFGRVLLPQKPDQNQFFAVSGLLPDARGDGRYWVSVWAVGLFEWYRPDGSFTLLDAADGALYSNELFGMDRDADGNLWMATVHGVERFDPRSRQRRLFKPSDEYFRESHKSLSVKVAPDGRVWHGNNCALLVETDPRTGRSRGITLYRHDGRPMPCYEIWNLALDARGRVLVSSPDGLLRYDPATGHNDHLLYRSPARPVSCSAGAPDGTLYVGTPEGVYVLDARDSLLRVLDLAAGLRNQNVRWLDIDRHGRLWIATANGLHRYDPGSGQIDYFNKSDGLFVSDLTSGFRVLPGTGELFASGEYSFNIADPDRLPRDTLAPRLVLDGVRVADRAIGWQPGQTVILHPGESVVTFDVAVIHFTHADHVTLAFKLDGFDDQWRETNDPALTYTNLDGGHYRLLVRARNRDGLWSAATLEVPLRVVPPFYRTWWFGAFLGFAMLGLTLGVGRYRRSVRLRVAAVQARAKELERQQLLNEIALLKTQVNPHFLFNSLSILSSLVHVDAELSEKFIDQLSRSYRFILEQKEQSVVALRTELEFIRSYAFLLQIRFDKKFELRLQIDDAAIDRHQIAPLTLQLLVENAVKHNRMSAREPLYVEVFAESDVLVVRNPLQPRSATEPSTGTGLSNIKSRYALLTERPVWAGARAGMFEVRVPLL